MITKLILHKQHNDSEGDIRARVLYLLWLWVVVVLEELDLSTALKVLAFCVGVIWIVWVSTSCVISKGRLITSIRSCHSP